MGAGICPTGIRSEKIQDWKIRNAKLATVLSVILMRLLNFGQTEPSSAIQTDQLLLCSFSVIPMMQPAKHGSTDNIPDIPVLNNT